MLHHPDRPGGDNPKYQNITEAYRIIGDYIESNFDTEGDSEEEIARHAFNCFNFDDIKENLFSFTIKIDTNLSPVWDSVLTKHYGEPADRLGNGKHWKHHNYSDGDNNNGDITIGKWHIPKKDKQSKINIQSSGVGNFLPAHFVSSQLPILLEEVKASFLTGPAPAKAVKSKSSTNSLAKKSNKKVPNALTSLPPSVFDISPPFNVLPATPTLPAEIAISSVMSALIVTIAKVNGLPMRNKLILLNVIVVTKSKSLRVILPNTWLTFMASNLSFKLCSSTVTSVLFPPPSTGL